MILSNRNFEGFIRLVTADVNRDGKFDLITSNDESGDVSVLLQR
jgi:hypothetical protein